MPSITSLSLNFRRTQNLSVLGRVVKVLRSITSASENSRIHGFDVAQVEIDQDVSDKYNPDICPVKLKAHFTHPANHWRGPVELVWYQGGLKPEISQKLHRCEQDRQRRDLRRHQGQHRMRLHDPRHHSQQ